MMVPLGLTAWIWWQFEELTHIIQNLVILGGDHMMTKYGQDRYSYQVMSPCAGNGF